MSCETVLLSLLLNLYMELVHSQSHQMILNYQSNQAHNINGEEKKIPNTTKKTKRLHGYKNSLL